MKKRVLSLFLILIFIIGTVSAAVPYKESLTIYNYKIKQVQCSDNSLRILVESKASANLNLMFKITSKTTNSIFSNQELKRFETNWFLITTNKLCNEFKKLEVNGYLTLNNQNIAYLNSESSYLFTGTESPITQTATTTEIQPSTQETLTTTTTSTSTSNIYFGSKLIESIDSNNEVKYYHQDNLGSTRLITDVGGNLVSRVDYEPFGKDLSYANSKYKFTGKEKDSSSLYYFGARYYDPNIGRFTQIDPSFEPSETPYSYVDNNPLNKVDPDGREAAPPPRELPRFTEKQIEDAMIQSRGATKPKDLARIAKKLGYVVSSETNNEGYLILDRYGGIVRSAEGRAIDIPRHGSPQIGTRRNIVKTMLQWPEIKGIIRGGTKAVALASIGLTVAEVAEASQEGTYSAVKQGLVSAGGLSGGASGAFVGMRVGLIFGPYGSLVGCIAGACIGRFYGEESIKTFYHREYSTPDFVDHNRIKFRKLEYYPNIQVSYGVDYPDVTGVRN